MSCISPFSCTRKTPSWDNQLPLEDDSSLIETINSYKFEEALKVLEVGRHKVPVYDLPVDFENQEVKKVNR